jgi:ABC-type oligopeptide transport system substrate-binding subunit
MNYRVIILVAGFVVAGGVASAAENAEPTQRAQQQGGTLRWSRPRDIDSIDPALAYNPDSWMLEFATCANLYNYPDKPAPAGAIPVPEVAKTLPQMSADGRTQTIRLKRTFRFNTGQPVTAANFVAAFNRDADPRLQSPATNYLHEIVGADAVIAGAVQTITGVSAPDTYTLRIRTIQPVRDLVSRLAMPFFCPIAVGTPPAEINNPPGSGPYYVADRVPNRQVVLKRNSFYRGSRRAHVDQIIMTIAGQEDCRIAVEQDRLDYCAGAGVGDAAAHEIVKKYGINRRGGRVFLNPTPGVNFFAFNHDRAAFKGVRQIPLKQAINWAIDRHTLSAAAGYLRGKPNDQILAPALTRPADIYPLERVTQRNLARARALLKKAKFRPTKLVVWARGVLSEPTFAQIFRVNLKRLGIDVEIKLFPSASYANLLGTRGAPFDVALTGWIPDYADAFTIFGPLLDGSKLQQTGNTNVAYFNRPRYNREIRRIARLTGKARRDAWAYLDVEMMRHDPPWAPVTVSTNLDFVSRSYGCFVFQPVLARPDLVAACKK